MPGRPPYVDNIDGAGVTLFEAVRASDMEASSSPKLAQGRYSPEETTWLKIKKPRYTQTEGRADFFDGQAYRMCA